MGRMAVVVGQAGTGKTTWLVAKANESAPRLITADHQRMLAITRMHGARRRLEHKLKGSCRGIPHTVATIDGFALSMVNPADRWRGTCALICPSHDPLLGKVLDSCSRQLREKNLAPIGWYAESSTDEEKERTASSLGLATTTRDSDSSWQTPSGALDGVGTHVLSRVQRFARLRGIDAISHRLVARHVDKVVREQRAYWSPSPSRTITTVHGAKNREFDNVFILWTYKLPPDVDQQRRLLYNAITRSRNNCMLLVLGNEKRACNDPVLGLLGPSEPAFPAKMKSRRAKANKDANR